MKQQLAALSNSQPVQLQEFELCLITADLNLVQMAQQTNIQRIMIDLETLGKAERQAGHHLFLSTHHEADVVALRKVLINRDLMVRINPLNEQSKAEIERMLHYGVNTIMLPMFETAAQISQFVDLVQGRARTSLLLENAIALANIDSIVKVPGINEIHVGLNDLRLSLGLDVIFEALCLGILDSLSEKIRGAGIRFGFGGVTSPRITHLPIAPTQIIAEQARLGSTLALLGRSFRRPFETHLSADVDRLKQEVDAIHHCFQYWQQASQAEHRQNRAELQQAVVRWRGNVHL